MSHLIYQISKKIIKKIPTQILERIINFKKTRKIILNNHS